MKEDDDDIEEMIKEAALEPEYSTGNLTDAVKTVYKRYGTDLSSFFDDAYKERERRDRERSNDNAAEACVL
jgi:hypothetical protein